MTFSIDKDYLTKLTQEMVQIDSINPSLIPDGKGEAPEPLYAVEFTARDLWNGDAEEEDDSMVLDLWQSYLTKANP